MDGWDLLKSIGAFAAGSTILITALGFIARSAFVHFLSHDLESHKAKLAADNALALEKFKAELRSASFEREQLHSERLRIIAELYERLSLAHIAFQGFLRLIQFGGREEHLKRIQEATDKAKAFFTYFAGKRVYFDAGLCKLIDDLETPFLRASSAFAPMFYSDEPLGKAWVEAAQEFTKTVPPLLSEIEARVRILLRVIERTDAKAAN